jgi:hypothetical protein
MIHITIMATNRSGESSAALISSSSSCDRDHRNNSALTAAVWHIFSVDVVL